MDYHELRIQPNVLINLFFFLISFFLFVSQGAVESADGMNLMSVTKNIVENGTFALKEVMPGAGGAPTGSDGRKYSAYAPGTSVFLIPFYLAALAAASLFHFDPNLFVGFAGSAFNSFVCAAIGVVLLQICWKIGFSVRTSLFTVILYSFFSMNLVYTRELYSHPLIGLFFLLACFYIYPTGNIGNIHALMAGFFAGLAVFTRFEMVIMLPCLAAFILLQCPFVLRDRLKRTFLFLCPAIFFVGLIMVYNYWRFGNVFSTGGYSANEGIKFSKIFPGSLALLISPEKGLISFNPLLLVALAGFKLFFDKSREFAVLTILVVVPIFLFYSMVGSVISSGWAWGPRHLVAILPFLMIPIGMIHWERLTVPKKSAFFLLAGLSLFLQLLSISVSPSRYYNEMILKHGNHHSLTYDFRDCIVLRQLDYIRTIGSNLFDAGFVQEMKKNAHAPDDGHAPLDRKMLLKTNISLNVLNFWWVYMYFAGFKWYWIAGGMFILATMALISGRALYRDMCTIDIALNRPVSPGLSAGL